MTRYKKTVEVIEIIQNGYIVYTEFDITVTYCYNYIIKLTRQIKQIFVCGLFILYNDIDFCVFANITLIKFYVIIRSYKKMNFINVWVIQIFV